MDGFLQVTGLVMMVSPLVGAVASGTGRIWGNVLTALACGVWAAFIVVAVVTSGDTRGPYVPIAVLLGAAAIVELALAWELAVRREAGRRDEGSLRVASVVVALGAMGLIAVLVYLIVVSILAFLASLSML